MERITIGSTFNCHVVARQTGTAMTVVSSVPTGARFQFSFIISIGTDNRKLFLTRASIRMSITVQDNVKMPDLIFDESFS